MALTVAFRCPNCDYPGRSAIPSPTPWICPQCGTDLPLEGEVSSDRVAKCAVCGDTQLYKKKNFPHALGMTILLVACVASFVTYLWYEKWLTWAILIGSAVFDGLLYLLVGDAIVCYRCQAHYYGVMRDSPHHKPFELTIGERYRQERLRKEQLGTTRSK